MGTQPKLVQCIGDIWSGQTPLLITLYSRWDISILLSNIITQSLVIVVPQAEISAEAMKGRLYMRGFDREGHPVLVWNGRLHKASEREVGMYYAIIYLHTTIKHALHYFIC
jgi:hypothetical protein